MFNDRNFRLLMARSKGLAQSLAWTPNSGNVTSVLQSDGTFLLTKTGVDGWDGGAYTALGGTGDLYFAIQPTLLNKNINTGFNALPAAAADNSDINRYLDFNGAAAVTTGIGGVGGTGFSTPYAAGEWWIFRRISGLYTLHKNSVESLSGATQYDPAFGAIPDNTNYGGDISLYYQGSSAKVRFLAL